MRNPPPVDHDDFTAHKDAGCWGGCDCPPGTRHSLAGQPLPREAREQTPADEQRAAAWGQAFAAARAQPDGFERLRQLVRLRRWQGRTEEWIDAEIKLMAGSGDFDQELTSRWDSPERVLTEAERMASGGIITRHLEDLAEISEDPEWVIEDWLAAQVVSGLVGLPNSGKTWIMGTEAASLSLGLPFPIGRENGKQTREIAGRGVAYCLWLDAPERQLKLRLGNIFEAMTGDRQPEGAALAWTIEPISVLSNEWWAPLIDALRDEEDRFGLPARYLGIDHAMHIGINNRDFASGINEFQVGVAQLRIAFPHLAVRLLIHAPRRVNWGAVLARGARDAPWGGVRVAQAMDATAIVEMAGPDPTRNYRALAVQSRDLPAQEAIAISFGTDRHVFDLRMEPLAGLYERDEKTEKKGTGSQAKYLSAIEKLGDRANESRISELAGVSRTAVHNALEKLLAEGRVHKDGIVWRIGEPPDDPQERMDF